jgi:hypothetical protein
MDVIKIKSTFAQRTKTIAKPTLKSPTIHAAIHKPSGELISTCESWEAASGSLYANSERQQ